MISWISFSKYINPLPSLLLFGCNICIVCEETNPVNVIKFVSFVTPSKLKFKNIYKMSKSDRSGAEYKQRAGQKENNPPLNTDSSVSTQGIISSKQSMLRWELWIYNCDLSLIEIWELFPNVVHWWVTDQLRNNLWKSFFSVSPM